MNLQFEDTSSVECLWKFELVDASGNVVETRDWQKNTVTDDGLIALITSDILPFYNTNGGLYSKIAAGSGTTAPTSWDTKLEGFMSAASIDLTNSSGSLIDATYNMKPIVYMYAATFGMNEAVGNISEVGLTSSSTNASGTYFCRNLVREGMAPSPITKDNAHLLRVFLKVSIWRSKWNCYWVKSLNSQGTTVTTYSVTGCLNNQWVIQSVVQSKNHATGRYKPWTAGAVTIGASTSYTTIATGAANISYSSLVSPTNGTGSSGAVVATGSYEFYNGDNTSVGMPANDRAYYIDLKVDIPKADLNMNIRSLYIKGFFQPDALTGLGVSGEGGMFMQFDPVLAKDSSKWIVFNFRHYWKRK